MTQPPHGPVGGVEVPVLTEEFDVVEVIFEKCEGFPDGMYGTAEGIMGHCGTLDEALVALLFG
jgi:hypothetical protein